MKFIVQRTSTRSKNIKPCDNAYQEKRVEWDWRENFWFIDIDNIMDFIEKNGQIVIHKLSDSFQRTQEINVDGYIEIYDEFRER